MKTPQPVLPYCSSFQLYNWGHAKKKEEIRKAKEESDKLKDKLKQENESFEKQLQNLKDINTEKGNFEKQLQECNDNITKTNEYHEKIGTAG